MTDSTPEPTPDPRRLARAAVRRTVPAALALAALMAVQPAPLHGQQERSMVDAVMRTFDLAGRNVYLVPVLFQEVENPNMSAVIRHAPQTLRDIERDFRARIMPLEDAIRCEDMEVPESCTIPGNGIIFMFFMPEPLRNNVLTVRLIVFYDGRGDGGQILREAWSFRLTRQEGVGWRVLGRDLVGRGQGPGL